MLRCTSTFGSRYGEILGRVPARSSPRLWVHAEGHFQLYKFEAWGEVWEEWKWKRGDDDGAPTTAENDGASAGLMMAKVEAKWTVTSKDEFSPRPSLQMKDESRGMEMNLTPEGCFFRQRGDNNSYTNWMLMAHGYWM